MDNLSKVSLYYSRYIKDNNQCFHLLFWRVYIKNRCYFNVKFANFASNV